MTLNGHDLAVVLEILDKIDRGVAAPSIPGEVGRFFRQYASARTELAKTVLDGGLSPRADSAVSGKQLGTIELYPLIDPSVGILEYPLGEVAQTIALCEQLGGLVHLRMWLAGAAASAVFNVFRQGNGARLSGDYRWTPPSGATTGEAVVEEVSANHHWATARCLKAVADDIRRPPHALEYILDYRIGRPGLKFFRSVCARRSGGDWVALPAFGTATAIRVAATLSEAQNVRNRGALAVLLIYREPWSPSWTVANVEPVSEDGAFAHCLTWADFSRELDGDELDRSALRGLTQVARDSGLPARTSPALNLTRQLLPAAASILRSLRRR